MTLFRDTLRSSHFIWNSYVPKHLEEGGHLPNCWLVPEDGKILILPNMPQVQDKLKFSHHSQNTILLRKENKFLRFKNLIFFNKSQQFSCLFNKTKAWVAQITWENMSRALTLAEDVSAASLWLMQGTGSDSCPGEEPNCCSYFSGIHTKQHSCNRDVSSRLPCSSNLNQANVRQPLSCVPKCPCLLWWNKSTPRHYYCPSLNSISLLRHSLLKYRFLYLMNVTFLPSFCTI